MSESASSDAIEPHDPAASGTPPAGLDKPPSYYISIGFHTAFGVLVLVIAAFCAYKLLSAVADVAPPFVVGTFLALLLDPVTHRLERAGIRRTLGIIVVVVITLVVLIGFGAIVIPRFVEQISNLASSGPGYINHLQTSVNGWLSRNHRIGPITLPISKYDISSQLSQQVSQALQGSAGNLLEFLGASGTTILRLVISLLVLFYILADTERLMGRALFLVPARYRPNVLLYSRDVGKVFSDYIRGLFIVCACYGATVIVVLYALAIWRHSLAGYALLVGVTAGVLYSIPYIGAFTIALMTFVIGFTAGGLPGGVITMLCVLSINWTYDNVITPRVVGGGVGLHPVAAILALALGARLAGFWGLLVSVPVAASIQVVLFRIFPRLTNPTPDSLMRSGQTKTGVDRRKIAAKRAAPPPKNPRGAAP